MSETMQIALLAAFFGGLSAASLPIGAVIGIATKPSHRVVAAVMAFGAGALLAALALELVVPALAHFESPRQGFVPLSIGAAIGCLAFIGLDQLFSNMGAFLRKSSTMASHLRRKKRAHYKELLEKLSQVDILLHLPAAEVRGIVHHVEDRMFPAGTTIFSQGDYGDSLYLIDYGSVEVHAHAEGGSEERTVAELGPGKTFGEMALLTGAPRTATVVAKQDVHTWEIHKEDFDELLRASPKLREAVDHLAKERLKEGKVTADNLASQDERVRQWREAAMEDLDLELRDPTSVEEAQAYQEHAKGGSNVALAMWLGIALDGIPESLVIGASMEGSAVSMALVAGLFMANLPESMSSAVVMKRQGASTAKILGMWGSLVVLTAVGAFIGNLFVSEVPPFASAMLEGLAAGAMLAMIAQTMLPEAFEHGGWLTGLMTVVGFLAAIFMGTFQEEEDGHGGHGEGHAPATEHSLLAPQGAPSSRMPAWLKVPG